MPYPNNSDDGAGFYIPEPIRYRTIPNYQEFINSTEGKLSVQDRDALHNLLGALPGYYAEGLQLAGEKVVWLRRLTTGQRCIYFSENDDQCTVSKCTNCFGTGFQGGYEPAIELKMSFVPGRSDILIEQAGLTVVQRPSGWTIITNPIMSEKDIIVSFANERYEIHSSEAVEHQGRKHHQELTLSRIDRNDVKYYVPVPFINGQEFTDFNATLVITPPIGVGGSMPGQNFPASIIIKNYFFNTHDGQNY
jgi:hypothetical protein